MTGNNSKVRLDYLEPGGSGTGKLLPTGNTIDEIEIENFVKLKFLRRCRNSRTIFQRRMAVKGSETPDEL